MRASKLTLASIYTLIFTIFILIGCGGDETKAPAKISESFGSNPPETPNAAPRLVLYKRALNKEFLLQSHATPQRYQPTGKSTKSRIVVFKRVGKRVHMLETNQGHTVSAQLPQRLIMASFDILEETEDKIMIDFNEGMKTLFIDGDWWGSTSESSSYFTTTEGAKVTTSYLEKAVLDDKNRLFISQVQQLRLSMNPRNVDGPVHHDHLNYVVYYYLSPYRPDPSFRPSDSVDLKNFGFFAATPQTILGGGTRVRATKFGLNKPIVFAVSSNTPDEFKQAIKDGVLYWNRAFDGNPLSVIEAPKGVTAPNIDYNVIQWVENDFADSAYADAQIDPRTGQTQHAQVFIPSMFAFQTKRDVRHLIAAATTKPLKDGRKGKRRAVSIHSQSGKVALSRCQHGLHSGQAQSLSALISLPNIETRLQSAAQDYIRFVTAHEIGHTLGLRHNFAGSLYTQNYILRDRQKIFLNYLNEGSIPTDLIPTSSVMDYIDYQEEILAGNQIKNTDKIFLYDYLAIRKLYYNESPNQALPPFCPDEQTVSSYSYGTKFSDCQQFDAGKSPMEFVDTATKSRLDTFPNILVETFIAKMAPMPGKHPIKANEVAFDHHTVANALLGLRYKALRAVNSSSNRILTIYRQFPFVSPLNLDQVKEKEQVYLEKEFERLGGLNSVFSVVPTKFYETAYKRVEELLATPQYREVVGLANQTLKITDKDVEHILATTKLLLNRLPNALTEYDLKSILKKFPTSWKTSDTSVGRQLAKLFEIRTNEYLFQEVKDENTVAEIKIPKNASKDTLGPFPSDVSKSKETITVSVDLPKFFYKNSMRERAADLLERPSYGAPEGSIDWGISERRRLLDRFATLVKSSCQCNIERLESKDIKVVDPALERTVTRWFLENKSIFETLRDNTKDS